MYYQSGSSAKTIGLNNVLASGFKLNANWEMKIDLKIEGPDKWANILQVKKIGLSQGQYGYRLPTIYVTPEGRLEVSASFSGTWNWFSKKVRFDGPVVRRNGWFTLNLLHNNGKFQIYIDNVLKDEYVNTIPQDWDNVELIFGFDKDGVPAAVAEFKNFVYRGFGKL